MINSLEVEEWEMFPDNYDGAQWMRNRGRIDYLEYLFDLENHAALSDKEERDPP